ncbi:MAG: hypothetical protein OH316_02225 [Candidatus Parvarchaeota archaeon]|nr:hypothetical protein [Candidatus Parvarchaeota archaeon]
MERAYIIFSLILALSIAFGASHAAGAIRVSISAVNASVGMDQNLYISVSYSSQMNSTYELSLNGTNISSGVLAANQNITETVIYNVSNIQYGSYRLCGSFSVLTKPLCSSSEVYIRPYPDLGFRTPEEQPVFNGSAAFNLSVFDSGNTPLSVRWSLPIVKGIDFSVSNYDQHFDIGPGETYQISVAVNTSLTKASAVFPFNVSFNGSYFQRSFDLYLFEPVVNMSFTNKSTEVSSGNFTYYTFSFINGNDVPVNLTAVFLLDTVDGTFSLSRSFMVEPNQTSINVTLPRSTVESVRVSYTGADGKRITETVYSAPTSPVSYVNDLIGYIFYVILTVGIVLIVVYIHLRHYRKG